MIQCVYMVNFECAFSASSPLSCALAACERRRSSSDNIIRAPRRTMTCYYFIICAPKNTRENAINEYEMKRTPKNGGKEKQIVERNSLGNETKGGPRKETGGEQRRTGATVVRKMYF